MRKHLFTALLGIVVMGGAACTPRPKEVAVTGTGSAAVSAFTGSSEETRGFMDSYRDIELTSQQEAVLVAALNQRGADGKPVISAPCCTDETAYTCCCECNMKRASHGLAKKMIAGGADAVHVREAVQAWFHAVNPSGFAGWKKVEDSACYVGGCGKPIKNDGCGGMEEGNLIS